MARAGMAAGFLYLAACMILGGSSAAGLLANAALQVMAVLILAILAFRQGASLFRGPLGALMIFGVLFMVFAALQAVPLPPGVWTALPGRAVAERAFDQLGLSLPYMSWSLNPDGAIAAALSILPPLAMVALLVRGGEWSRLLPVAIAILAVIAMLLGVAQQAGSRDSPLYFYAFTNWGSMVGFFANVNHQATLLLMSLPFVAALASPTLRGGRLLDQDRIPKLLILACLYALLAGAVAIGGSRMGLALLLPVTLFCIGMIVTDLTGRVSRLWLGSVALMLAAGAIVLAGSGAVLKQELSSQPGEVGTTRGIMWQRTADIVPAFMPAGSGFGTFVPLYRMNEEPDRRTRTYANHAHNDYLEWVLETGVAGILLLGAFFLWWGRRMVAVWRTPAASLGRAGSVATAALMLHSLVDYPVRTAAIAVLAAIACTFLAREPAPKPKDDPARTARRRG
ncbi:O-antigen ligase family protein [Sphingosinicella rhizophila]|uniref:O-antigen ligase family protein n=1 Tax=Sphingosinicella rhizophila TaxID=3050082 RepID=A0ABU3Q6H6_9SPHN|nr:O-antigen ligase family protein [Sphingosinicella sp. GR2756]MDT9598907.1 O-antigen ligase family protein [Sphingosinicella sp. GR2756]